MPQPIQRSSPSPREKPVPSYPIPRGAADAFEMHKRKSPQNAGLIFDRFVPDTRDSNEAKKNGFGQVVEAEKKADVQLLTALNARWALNAKLVHAELFMCKTDWRFVTGLGRKGPLEAGFTFNRYGFPILPGSSVKGIARAYAFFQLAEVLKAQLEHIPNHADPDAEPDDRKELDNASPLNRLERIIGKDDDVKYRRAFAWYYGADALERANEFRVVFGTTSKAGCAVFLDAIPKEKPTLQLDIMNPHFPDYYGDNTSSVPPTDWQNPSPVLFLTVAPNTEFCFAVGWRGTLNQVLRDQAKEWLIGGLTELGAGAKTSAGYGYFKQDGDAQAKTETPVATAVSQPASTPPARPSTRHTAVGKVRYESGKPVVRSEEGKRWHVNWKELGVNALKEKTLVEIEYDEFEDGMYKVLRVTKKGA
jgi:CRISPR-associated protein Cmr6